MVRAPPPRSPALTSGAPPEASHASYSLFVLNPDSMKDGAIREHSGHATAWRHATAGHVDTCAGAVRAAVTHACRYDTSSELYYYMYVRNVQEVRNDSLD